MSREKIMLGIVFLLIISLFYATDAFAVDKFMRSDLYTVTEHENMSDFDLSNLARTSAFGWKLSDGSAPMQKYENGLPAYSLIASSDNCILEYFSAPSAPIDAYEYRSLSFAVRITAGEFESYVQNCRFILSLSSGEKKLECEAEVQSGIWNVITFDTSVWKHRKNIDGITVSIIGENNDIALNKVELSGPYVKEENIHGMENFMSYGLYASGTEIEITDKGTSSEALRINLNSQRVNINGTAAIPFSDEDCNAVRIILTNNSELRSLQFGYNYFDPDSGRYASSSKSIDIAPSSRRSSYIIETGEVSFISDFSMILDSASKGNVIIHSILPVSVYEGFNEEIYGSITNCTTDKAKKNLIISGSVNHNYLISHDDHTLVCYMLRSGETFAGAVADGRKPDAKVKMSSRFSFEIKLSRLGEFAMIAKYAVASLSPDGKLTLLAPPKSPESNFGKAETAQGRINIKGLESEYIPAAIDCGVGTTVFDVYLDKLTGRNQGGHLYTIENTFMYFDADYVSYLDKNIKNLYASGCKVYLRLLISNDADRDIIPYVTKAESDTAQFLAVDISSPEAEKNFYGTVDFLASRYSKASNGKISGMILGKSIDKWESFNFTEKTNIADYAKTIADAFEIMARCAASSIDGLEVLMPISDSRGSEHGYDSELLLISICRYLEIGGDISFSLMLEGTHTPYSLIDISDNDRNKQEPTQADEESSYYCTDNISIFENMLKGLSRLSDNAPLSYVYLWSPDLGTIGNELSAAYIYNYYSIMFSDMASAFILSLPEGDAGISAIKKLNYLMKYIDTDRNSNGTLCLSALDHFGADSWNELIPDYDKELITYRILKESSAEKVLPSNITGSYALWDFSTSFGTMDWFEGSNCSTVYVDATASGGKALCAEISGRQAKNEYSDIVYNYEFWDDISLLPYIGVDLYIENGDSSELYEITVIIGGNGHRMEAVATAHSGENSSIYVNTQENNGMDRIEYIRIRIRRVSTGNDEGFKLYLRSVKAYSDILDDAGLESAVKSARALARNTTVQTSAAVSQEPKYEFIIAMVIIIILSVALVGFYDRKQK